MKLLCSIQKSLQNAADRNRRHAQKNRIRLVMKGEADVLNRAYIALGKYYYEHLRSLEPGQPARLCDTIEQAKARLLQLNERLLAVDAPLPAEEEDDDCADPAREADDHLSPIPLFLRDEEGEEESDPEDDKIVYMNQKEHAVPSSYLDAEREAADEAEEVIPPLEEAPGEDGASD